MNYQELVEKEHSLLCKTYARYPLAIKSAKGSLMWDFAGKEYIDLLSGIAVTSLGHCNEELNEVIVTQSQKLFHVSNLFYQEEQLELAEKLIASTKTEKHSLDKVFFCNSGAEANEAAIKLARRFKQKVENKDAYEVISLTHAFHGRTLATVAATGQAKFQDGFMPMPQGFLQAQYGNINDIKSKITDKTAAIIVEPIQGEGGVRPLSDAFAKELQALCAEKNILLICDEVQAGLCRSGKNWGYQHYELKPDIITTAKALANGLPLGAMLCTNKISEGFAYGSHATTFGGGALLTKVGSKVLEIMQRDNLANRAKIVGDEFKAKVLALKSDKIKEVRGKGLLIGIELNYDDDTCKKIWTNLLESGFVLNLTQGTTLRLLPALNIPEAYLDKFIDTLVANI